MKKHWKMLLILGAMLIALWGCQRDEDETIDYPSAVTLTAPQDGTHFKETPPTFLWSSDSLATSYILRIATDEFSTGAVLIKDTLTDTIYKMSENLFSQIYQGTYEWAVAPLPAEDKPLWSDAWSFSVDKSLASILIAPEDGAVFDLEPPDFVWHKDSEATNYVIRIVKDAFFTGEKIVVDTLKDTTYTMTQEDFEIALNADYVWSVAPIIEGGLTWREFRTIIFDKPLPAPPQLVSPKEGAEFSTDPPTFIWRSVSLAKAYIILFHGENLPYGDTIVVDILEDTTYALPPEVFEGCYNGTYKWSVASLATTDQTFWSGERSLSFNQPAPQLDLDTTYFPFGLEYVWTYEYYGAGDDEYGSWEEYDTVTIRVVDSSFVSNGWSFDLEGWSQQGYETGTFIDVGDPARIIGRKVLILGGRRINILPETVKEVKGNDEETFTFEISYKGDTLTISSKASGWFKDDSPMGGHGYNGETTISRLNNIGVVRQYKSFWEGSHSWRGSSATHTLISFSKNGKIVWRREGS
ncbi:MAG: hypothetical protein U9Q76_10420 [candidate division WOR-3 bacterium]|nr:hypothetical protein [candidate division WOR-3 bacterium]